MGLSSLPSPSEGMLCLLLVNTAYSISIVKGIVQSILYMFGIRISSDTMENSSESSFESRSSPSDSYIEEFRSRISVVRFNSVCSRPEHDCSVCLNKFDGESEINQLSCGHLFHKVCLEKWLDYWNITCPLCRTPLMPEEEEEDTSYY